MDTPLELTTNKIPPSVEKTSPVEENKPAIKPNFDGPKPEIPSPMLYPTPNAPPQDGSLVMPPPAPIWYPSLYPSPYGIDPLHFFIDLRVSGHIYDRKNQKDAPSVSTPPHIPQTIQAAPERNNTEQEQENLHGLLPPNYNFKQTRHASAFSVPIPSVMNLSSEKSATEKGETKNTKFDVKSMGFDKSYSKTSTNYIMSNIGNIYKALTQENSLKSEACEMRTEEPPPESCKDEEKAEHEETEEEKQKRVKDLRALIGLELVVDYMNHAKPGQPQEAFEDSSGDADSSASSAVEVVSVEENSPDVLTY